MYKLDFVLVVCSKQREFLYLRMPSRMPMLLKRSTKPGALFHHLTFFLLSVVHPTAATTSITTVAVASPKTSTPINTAVEITCTATTTTTPSGHTIQYKWLEGEGTTPAGPLTTVLPKYQATGTKLTITFDQNGEILTGFMCF